MEKKNKVIILLIALIAVVVVVVLLANDNQTAINNDLNNDNPVSENGENGALLDEEGMPDVTPEPISVSPDLNWKEVAREKGFEVEYMTVEEKETMRINPELQVQVLARNEDGLILAYKMIETTEDVVTSPDEQD